MDISALAGLRAPLTKTALGALSVAGVLAIAAILNGAGTIHFRLMWSAVAIAFYCGTSLSALRTLESPKWSGLAAAGVQMSLLGALFFEMFLWFDLQPFGFWGRIWMNSSVSALGIAQISYIVLSKLPENRRWLQSVAIGSTGAAMGLFSLLITLKVVRYWPWKITLICAILAIASTSAVKMIQRAQR